MRRGALLRLLLAPWILQLAQSYGVTCEKIRALDARERAEWATRLQLSESDTCAVAEYCAAPPVARPGEALRPWLRRSRGR